MRIRSSRHVVPLLVGLLILAACSGEDAGSEESPDAEESGSTGTSDDEQADAESSESEEGADEVAATADLSGETIRLLVPFGAGGGADTAARLLAPILSETIPGQPDVVVENREGGGGAIGMNALLTEGQDGLSMVVVTPGITLRWATGETGHDYALPEFQAVAGVAGTTVTVTPSSVATSVEELIESGETFSTGNPDPDSENSMIEFTAAEFLGIDLSQTFGFEGYGETALSMARGEIDGSTASSGAYSDFQAIEGDVGGLTLLFQQGIAIGDGEIVRAEQFADVPTALEVYEQINGEEPAGEMADIHRAIVALTTSQQNFLMHPDAPSETVDALAEGFESAFATDDFESQAVETYDGAVPETLSAADVSGIIGSLADLPAELRDFIATRRE